MIVFDLQCSGGHVFEAWFGSSAAWESQRAAGQVACPVCGDTMVGKAVMAPAVAAKGNARDASAPSPAVKDAIRRLADLQAGMLAQSQWVGSAFVDRARAMHSGEETAATIHGQASVAEARALVDEGIPVMPLPLPVLPPDQVN